MIQYKIATAYSVDVLITTVEELIKDGWIPQGGVCSGTGFLLQAMIKTSIDEDVPW